MTYPRPHRALFLPLLAVLLATACVHAQLQYVDPFVGTGPDGHTFPGATVPFGMVQLSPDTQVNDFKHSYKWAAGYRFEDSTLLGFSHTHFSGSGHSDLGDILIAPFTGALHTDPLPQRFDHAHEAASPGFYSVDLLDSQIKVELTTTPHVGLHRDTFPAAEQKHILVDLRSSIYNYPGKVLWSQLTLHNDGTLTGMRETRGWAPGRKLFFAIKFSQPIIQQHLYDKEPVEHPYPGFKTPGTTPEDTQSIYGRGLVAVVDFAPSAAPLVIKVALSPTSEDAAIANMQAEVPAFAFDEARKQAIAAWQQQLAALDLHAPEPMLRNLYTALYHSLISPNLAQDVAGTYRGPDNQVHQANGFHFVSNLSLWDTFRAQQPLITLLQPASRTADLVNSMLASWRESPFGILPIWQEAGLETWCMIGYHAVPILADAVMKNIPGFDREEALRAADQSANYTAYGHLAEYTRLGYVPVDDDDEAASQTVEYAFDDWTIAQMALKLGRQDLANHYTARAANWRNNFNSADGFVEPRLASGRYRTPFNPARAGHGSGFTEGNAWQYSWFVPQDTQGLINTLGGPQKLVAKLDQMFDQKVDPKDYADVEDISGMIGQYIHGNEPSHHLAYLYGYAGQPWRTQARLAQIVSTQYRPTPDGLVGNDDLGQMSSWLLFTALGFYPVAPGSNQYVIGRPFVESATLNLPNGRHFLIKVDNPTLPYIARLTLNGKPLGRTWITHDEIEAGGTLHFTMSGKEQATWSTGVRTTPYSLSPALPTNM